MIFFHLCQATLLIFANSYIHPDEHFQSLEVLAGRIFDFSVDIPWEFSSTKPARSFAVLYIVYGPLLYLIRTAGISLSTIHVWYLVKFQNIILTYVITYFYVKRIPPKINKEKSMHFIWTSYITLVYQSHCFSNTIETWLVLLAVVMLSDLQDIGSSRVFTKAEGKHIFLLGVLFSIGVFNRVTFPCFVIIPSYFLLKRILNDIKNGFFFGLGLSVMSLILIFLDSYLFENSMQTWSVFDARSFTVTPLNNILYNSNFNNLTSHGYHPYYTHLLVNLPLMFGPGLIMLLYIRKLKEWMIVPFMSILGGFISLSCLPHQELRFLTPIVPLVCSFLSEINSKTIRANENSAFQKFLLMEWYFFNIVLVIIMGVFHQGGVIPATQEISKLYSNNNIAFVWWHTYYPPLWLFGRRNFSLRRFDDENYIYTSPNDASEVIDVMGSSVGVMDRILKALMENKKKVYLCTPKASLNLYLKKLKAKEVWQYRYHLDLDHIDWTNHQSLTPGLCIYELL